MSTYRCEGYKQKVPRARGQRGIDSQPTNLDPTGVQTTTENTKNSHMNVVPQYLIRFTPFYSLGRIDLTCALLIPRLQILGEILNIVIYIFFKYVFIFFHKKRHRCFFRFD